MGEEVGFEQVCHNLYQKYRIQVYTWKPYRYINTHTIVASGTITYQRHSIMNHVYSKGFFKKSPLGILQKRYFLDVMVYPDGSLVFQRFDPKP
jgi:hypothetical protein